MKCFEMSDRVKWYFLTPGNTWGQNFWKFLTPVKNFFEKFLEKSVFCFAKPVSFERPSQKRGNRRERKR